MRRAIVPLVAGAVTLLSACSVPTSESATAVAPDDLPPELQPVVTQSSTTSMPPTGADVTIYLYNTETRVLEPVVRLVPTESVTVNTAMTELFKPTTEAEADANLISLLEADAEDEEVAGGLQLEQVQAGPTVVRIRIRGTPSGGPQAQAQAFAQMVFTASQSGLAGDQARGALPAPQRRRRAGGDRGGRGGRPAGAARRLPHARPRQHRSSGHHDDHRSPARRPRRPPAPLDHHHHNHHDSGLSPQR